MKKPIVNPLDLVNAKLGEARDAAKSHLAQIKFVRSQMERAGFTYPATATVAEVAADGAEWERKRTALRSAERNFNEATFIMDLLDDLPETKRMLEAAFEYLQARHKAYLKATRASLLATLTDALKPSQSAQDEAPTREPVRGPFGAIEQKPLEIELASIATQVEVFPDSKSLAGVLTMMNVLNGRLQLPEERPVQAKRQDRPFVVRERPSPPQPRTPYTHQLPMAQTSQTEAARRSYVITGA
jgi:hypothetical protein